MSADSSPGSSADTNGGGAVADDVPESVAAMVGKPMYEETATFPVERSYGYNTLAATQNANPLFWDEAVAEDLTGGITLPPTTLSLWMRPHYWEPGAVGEQVALKVHFDLKSIFGLPEAVMTDNTIIFHSPVRPGDVISNRQVLKSVSGPKTTKLGAGRFWVIDVEFHNQNGELVGVESYTGFGYNRPAAADAAAGGRADSAAGGSPASEGASA
ncbi:MAG: MaoC family dehydratase N-terminal domain-containing protein [Microthrixaceae bacterium]